MKQACGVTRRYKQIPTHSLACSDGTSARSLRRNRRCLIAATPSKCCRTASAASLSRRPRPEDREHEDSASDITYPTLMPPSPESPSFCQSSRQPENLRASGLTERRAGPIRTRYSTLVLTASSSLSTDGREEAVSFSQLDCPTAPAGCASHAGRHSVLAAIMDSRCVARRSRFTI